MVTTDMAKTLFERLLKRSTASSTACLKIDSLRPCESFAIFFSEVLMGCELVLRSCLSRH